MKTSSCAAVVLALSACGGSQTEQAAPATAAQQTGAMAGYEAEARAQDASQTQEPAEPASKTPPADPSPSATGVQIEQSLASYCELSLPNAFFDYDSSELRARGSEVLNELSACLNSEALSGRSIEIVGHADPRGGDQYNEELGRSRAESVADYLSSHGVSRDRLQVRSMGEQLASDRPQDYAIERRVDIRLVGSDVRRPQGK